MVLLGFMLNYALRVNLTIAIVEMIYDTNDNSTLINSTDVPGVNVTQVCDIFQIWIVWIYA